MPSQVSPAASRGRTSSHHHRSAFLIARVAAVVLGGALVIATPGIACDIPVYEYTITTWRRDPYEVLYLYRGAQDPKDKQVNDHLKRTEWGRDSNANFVFTAADVATLEQGQGRGLARQVWEWHKSRGLPFHVVVNPRGAELFVGRLEVSTVKAMVQSAKRKELATQLCDGKHGLLVLLLGPDGGENTSARKAVRDALAEAKKEGVDVGLVEVKRDDGTEKWLVEQLLVVEDDLKEIQRAMVFGSFGRGHVLEPFVGKGITYENMLDLLAFINGPCSCEIKAASPGVDLLTDWDWEAHTTGWPVEDDEVAFEADTPEPTTPEVASRPVRVKGTPGSSPSSTRPKPTVTKPPAGGAKTPRPLPGKPEQAPQVKTDNPAPPAAPMPPAGARDKQPLGDPPDVEEEGRGPALPVGEPVASTPDEKGPPLSSELAMGLGLGMGGAAVVAAGAGFFLMWRRREP